MLTKLTIRNFKRFENVDVELASPVVFVGPNNSGKTTALQALALWSLGCRRWLEKRGKDSKATKRTGVTLNRRDLINLPTPAANLLWRNLKTQLIQQAAGKAEKTSKVFIDIIVEGIHGGVEWKAGLEFYYANEESFYCRPIRLDSSEEPKRMVIPDHVPELKLAYLPPMSGLAAVEDRLDDGAIGVRIGEGRTAEVLRNLCHTVHTTNPGAWKELVETLRRMFGVGIEPPEYVSERGQITMRYRDEAGNVLDISSAGRGLHQTLLILAYLEANPGAVLLLDEPDAHLEILRQREIYSILTDFARAKGSQLVIASHSEVILTEAQKDLVVAFVGTPKAVTKHGDVLKALRDIPFHQYLQAEERGWVLYTEGPSDLEALRTFARLLTHPLEEALLDPFVRYVGNQPNKAEEHFYGLRHAVPELKGIALFDRLDKTLNTDQALKEVAWSRREVENYYAFPETLEKWAASTQPRDLFSFDGTPTRRALARELTENLVPRVALTNLNDPWWIDTKISEQFLERFFASFFDRLTLPNIMKKTSYHEVASFAPPALIPAEVKEKLDAIETVRKAAKPKGLPGGG